MKNSLINSLRYLFAVVMVTSLAVGGSYSALAEDSGVATPPAEETVTPEPPVESENPVQPEEPVEPEPPVTPEDPTEPETPVVPEDEGDTEDALDNESQDTGSSLELVDPLAQVPGTVITLTSTDPVNEDPDEWAFRITNGDASIRTVTVEFANGEVVTSNFQGSARVRTAYVNTNLDSTVVSAVTHSSLENSGAQLEIFRGPVNAQPDDQLHTANINVVPAVPGLNWALTSSAGAVVASGITDDSGVITVVDLPATGYTVTVTDPEGNYHTGRTSFSVVNADVTVEVALQEAAEDLRITFTVTARGTGGERVADANVILQDASGTTIVSDVTNAEGVLVVEGLRGGTYTRVVSADGFSTQSTTFELTDNHGMIVALDPVTSVTLSGAVGDASDGEGIPDATVTIVGTDVVGTTDEDGNYVIEGAPGGYQDVTFSAPGYQPVTLRAVLTDGDEFTLNAALLPVPTEEITLNVVTSDDGNPAGTTYIVAQDDVVLFDGTFDETGEELIGDLPTGETYDVHVDGGPAGYSFEVGQHTVIHGYNTWTVTLEALPTEQAMTLEVITSDDGSPEGAIVTLSQNEVEIDTFEVDDTGEVALGELTIDESYLVSVDGEPAGYLSNSGTYTVVRDQGTWAIQIDPIPEMQEMTLNVVTSDEGSPEGALYTVLLNDVVVTGGEVDETGIVALGELEVGESYLVSIDGESVGYQPVAGNYTVVRDETTWGIEINPITTIPTEAITLAVTTADDGSPEGATYVITEAVTAEGTVSLFLATTPITGTLPASGEVEVGDLAIGTSYTVAIDGAPAGYQDATVTFEVVEGENTWALVLQPLEEEPAPIDPVVPAPKDPKSPKVTDLPETGTGTSGNSSAITLFSTGALVLLMLGAFVSRLQRSR